MKQFSSYRERKQRFHKGRQGSILMPHAALSGLLFTINPRQDQRAMREAQLYLNNLTSDLRAAHHRFQQHQQQLSDGVGVPAVDERNGEASETAAEETLSEVKPATTSSLLAAELAEAMEHHHHHQAKPERKRGRGQSDDDEHPDSCDQSASDKDDDEGGHRRGGRNGKARAPLSEQWFASLETSCKGYMLLNIPTVNPMATCVVCRAGGGGGGASEANKSTPNEDDVTAGEREGGEGVEEQKSPSSALPPHAIVVNPLVSHVVERVFADLLSQNGSPVFRHCFRLSPVELTCCPTLPEMQVAVKHLLAMHFPPAAKSGTDATTTGMTPEGEALSFEAPIPLAEPLSHGTPAGTAKKVKHMHTVALNFNVKNNTNVEAKKAQFQTQLQSAIPMNRFIVVSLATLSQKKVAVDAVLCVHVIHATCVMGVQRLYNERRGYHLHDLSEEKLELSNSVVPTKPPTAEV